ncbi:MAG: hypothetical protein HAW62_06260 [Endozoicomonadaceae bacterium]|nr:hypothetical protein [Endozoicomonadaceae bacterium]
MAVQTKRNNHILLEKQDLKKTNANIKNKKSVHCSEAISKHIQFFLDAGGIIKKIPKGQSGQVGGISFRKSMTIKTSE